MDHLHWLITSLQTDIISHIVVTINRIVGFLIEVDIEKSFASAEGDGRFRGGEERVIGLSSNISKPSLILAHKRPMMR